MAAHRRSGSRWEKTSCRLLVVSAATGAPQPAVGAGFRARGVVEGRVGLAPTLGHWSLTTRMVPPWGTTVVVLLIASRPFWTPRRLGGEQGRRVDLRSSFIGSVLCSR